MCELFNNNIKKLSIFSLNFYIIKIEKSERKKNEYPAKIND